MPLNMFVFPAREGHVTLPAVFAEHARDSREARLRSTRREIEAKREAWIQAWDGGHASLTSGLRYAKVSGGRCILAPVAFLAVFYVYPLLSLFDISLRPAGVARSFRLCQRLLSTSTFYLRNAALHGLSGG